MLRISLAIASFFFVFCAHAQEMTGARAAALNNTSVAISDLWSGLSNQAGLTGVQSFSAGVSFQNRYAVKDLSDKALVIASPLGIGKIGLSLHSFGNSNYSDSRLGLAYAMSLNEKFSVGVQLNYHQLRITEGYGSRQGVSVEIGAIYRMNEHLLLAAHIANPTRSALADYRDERRPSVLRMGATYVFSQKVSLLSELIAQSEQRVSIKGALEYQAVENFFIRAGAGSMPSSTAFGIGYQFSGWRLDAASSWHNTLGFSPQLSLSYIGNAKK
ncbi:MAG: hypothetical protein ACOVOO_09920 [Flavobacteriales bacterium]